MYQFSLHCVDGTTELDIAFDPTHERPEQTENQKISSLQDANLTTNDGDRPIIDDRRNSCCHSEAGQDKQDKMWVLILTRLRWKETTTNEGGTITAYVYFLWLSLHKGALFICPSQRKASVGNGRLGHLVHALFFGIQ